MSIPSWQLEDKSNSGQKEDNFVKNVKTDLNHLSGRSETFEDETTTERTLEDETTECISKSSKIGRTLSSNDVMSYNSLTTNGLHSSPDIVSQE